MDRGNDSNEYLVARPSINLINVDLSTPLARQRFLEGLAGQNLTPGRIAEARRSPPGFRLKHRFAERKGTIQRFAWSPDGRYLASPEQEGTIGIWDTEQGRRFGELTDREESLVSYTCVAWSPTSRQQLLATGDANGLVRIWNVGTKDVLLKLRDPAANPGTSAVYSGGVAVVAWSPDGRMLAAAVSTGIVLWRWNGTTAKYMRTLNHSGIVTCLAWSGDGNRLASASSDRSIVLWTTSSWRQFQHIKKGHEGTITGLAWLLRQDIIASSSEDGTIRLWDFSNGNELALSPLTGHSSAVVSIAFSYDGCFLASKSHDETVRLWYHDNWQQVAVLAESSASAALSGLAFHPTRPLLATLGRKNTIIRIWELDFEALAQSVPARATEYYSGAKVVLVGDSAAGKTGLWEALLGRTYRATDSTHALQIECMYRHPCVLAEGNTETQEIFLWDLAGQTHVRQAHQLYLHDIAVALIVFDATSVDPFDAIHYWVCALRQAWLTRQRQGYPVLPMKIFLVAGRIDTCPLSPSMAERIERLQQDLDIDSFFMTSAQNRWQISDLRDAIIAAIEWSVLRQAVDERFAHEQSQEAGTLALIRQIQRTLAEKERQGKLFATIAEVSQDIQSRYNADRFQFQACINWMEMQGLLQRYIFDDYEKPGDYLIFKPDLLGTYASCLMDAILGAGKAGTIAETDVRTGAFAMPLARRIQNKEDERFLLLAMGQELLRQEFAFRTETDDTLTFPSLCEDEDTRFSHPTGQMVSFAFRGAPRYIYTTLVVRLKRSGRFHLQRLLQNTAIYITRGRRDTRYGVILHERGKGEGKLTLFFQTADGETSTENPDDAALDFEDFVREHLTRALPGVIRRDIFSCTDPACDQFGIPIPDERVDERRRIGKGWIYCQGSCDERIPIVRVQQRLVEGRNVENMNQAADAAGRKEARDFSEGVNRDAIVMGEQRSVYFCYNDEDELTVRGIAQTFASIEEEGACALQPFLRGDAPLGSIRLQALWKQIAQARVALVFVSNQSQDQPGTLVQAHGLTSAQERAMLRQMEEAALQQTLAVVVPVFLPGTSQATRLPGFLATRVPFDLRTHAVEELARKVRDLL